MAAVRPELRVTETYTESNFLRLHTRADGRREGAAGLSIVTLEHLSYRPADGGQGGWTCATIVDGEAMSKRDAVFIARAYARENGIPVIYQSHGE
ncbi:MAG: hypothetical protein JXB36_02545 [Gammaproteobacteria bacterium]|nr:hypothetical protein [Gammaproteobacteria bacterium]